MALILGNTGELTRPLRCNVDLVRLFGKSDIGDEGLGAGWSPPEDGHLWNDGAEASLLVSIPGGVAPPLRLSVLGEPYVTQAHPRQTVTLFANGHRAACWHLTRRTETELLVDLEPEWWFARADNACMRFDFCFADSARPSDIEAGEDARQLAFCFRQFCLRRSPHQ